MRTQPLQRTLGGLLLLLGTAGAVAQVSMGTTVPASLPSAHATHPGLLVMLERQRGRPLSPAERQVVHDVLRDTVESWRKTQAEFSNDAALALRTTPEVIDSTLPRKGLRRIGATRDEGWLPRVEHALGRRLTPQERQRLDRLASDKHARIWAAREQANVRLARALGMPPAAIDSAWHWPEEPATPHAMTPATVSPRAVPALPLPTAPQVIHP